MAERFCVYTAVFGAYERLRPAPPWPSVDKICFIDRAVEDPRGWTLRRVEPALPLDAARSQRFVKTHAHRLLPDYDTSLYIDNSIDLFGDPRAFAATIMSDREIGFLDHSFRETVLQEFSAVEDAGMDDPARLHEQLHHYAMANPSVLTLKPVCSGIIARRHHAPAVVRAMEDWFHNILRYSRRDQLSVLWSLTRCGIAFNRCLLDIRESEFHRWPAADLERHPSILHQPGLLTGDTAAVLERLSARIADLESSLQGTREAERQTRTDLSAKLDASVARADALAMQLEALTGSLSWRAGHPLRLIARSLPGGLRDRLAGRLRGGGTTRA